MLLRHISGSTLPRSEAHMHQQVLMPDEKDVPVKHIYRMLLMSHPPPIYTIIETAKLLLKNCIGLIPLPIKTTALILVTAGSHASATVTPRSPACGPAILKGLICLRVVGEAYPVVCQRWIND